MPVAEISALDEPIVWDASPSFSGGQASATRANLLRMDQYADSLNMDISNTGEIVTRRGTKHVGPQSGGYVQELIHFETPTISQLVGFNYGLHYYDGSGWTTHTSFTGSDPYGRVSVVQGVDKLYFVTGELGLRSYDGTTITDLTGGTNTHPPVGARILAWHTDRLVAAGMPAEPDAIYFSQFLEPQTWNRTTWQIRVGAGEGDPITGLVPWTNYNLVVLKRRSIWVVNTDPTLQPAEFTISPVHKRIGVVAPQTAVQVGSDILVLTDSGVRSITRTIASERQNEVGEALSEPVKDILDRITTTEMHRCCATYWNHRYMLSLPLDGSTVPNYVLVYNTITDTWSGLWTGWKATCFGVKHSVNAAPRLVIGDGAGFVREWLDWVRESNVTSDTFTDSGPSGTFPIASMLKTRAFTFNEPANPKTGYRCEFEFNKSFADVDISLIRDDAGEEEFKSFSTLTESVTLPSTLPLTLPRAGIVRKAFGLLSAGQFRELQFRLESAADKLSLRSIAAGGLVDTLEAQS